MEKTKIGFVQINTEFDGQVYLPLAAGYLRGHLSKYSVFSDDLEFGSTIYKRMPVLEAAQSLQDCDVVAFSIYVWNEKISLRIAEQYKKIRIQKGKRSLVVFGGPQVPDYAQSFLSQNTFVDIVVHNEGEEAFVEIIDNFHSGHDLLNIQNTSANSDGHYAKVPNRKRIANLDTVPSPFLNGIFDEILANNETQSFLALWESNRGCPFQCTFCDWGSATAAKVNQFPLERLKSELEWIAKKEIEFVFVCDANFGILPRDVELAEIVANLKNHYGYPHAFSVQSTKNLKERAFRVQKILSDAGLSKGVTLSMQSLDTGTLELIKRENISLHSYHDLQDRFKADGIMTYSDLILGLPGETLESWKSGISTLINNGQHNRIQFNNLSLLPNAEMSSAIEREKHAFHTVRSEIVNVHGRGIDDFGEVKEWQELVVGSKYMPKPDWIVARVFAWWVALLYFDKLAVLPIVSAARSLERETGDVLRELIDTIETTRLDEFPILQSIKKMFQEQALAIQEGEVEYQKNPKWLDVYWPADEYAFILLVTKENLDDFYGEIGRLIETLLAVKVAEIDDFRFQNKIATELNSRLLRLPNSKASSLYFTDSERKQLAEIVSYQFPFVDNSRIQILNYVTKEELEFDEWLRKVVWYGHRSGNYIARFFDIQQMSTEDNQAEVSGHFS